MRERWLRQRKKDMWKAEKSSDGIYCRYAGCDDERRINVGICVV